MIQVNQCVNEMSIHLLESVISRLNKEGDPQAKHAMLLVNSKVSCSIFTVSKHTHMLKLEELGKLFLFFTPLSSLHFSSLLRNSPCL